MQTRPPPFEDPRQPAPIRADLAQAASKARRARGAALAVAAAAAIFCLGFVGIWTWRFALSDLPSVPEAQALWSLNRPPGLTFLDRSGAVIGRRGPFHGQPLRLAEIPDYVPKAFLAAEDRNFYAHPGVDVAGVLRAAAHDAEGSGGALQGGSTLTQQLARTLFLGPEQTLKRKLQEAILALELERRLSKTEILELYLNRIYFGAGAYGLQAAAETYFDTPAAELTLPEAAVLAALPKAPGHLGASADYPAAVARSHFVLEAMTRAGWISPAAARAAAAAPPRLARTSRTEGDFGYVFDLAAKEVREINAAKIPDLVVRLTVDARLSGLAAESVRRAVRDGASQGVTEGAFVALAGDGGVLALVGGVDHRASPFDRATQALRQPGSTFKPLVYAAALEAGLKPEDVRLDAPVQIGAWRPTNSEGTYAGPVTLTTALARSLNTVAARVGHEVGEGKVAALARRFGLMNIPVDPRPPVSLGAYEVTLLDLAAAYQVFQEDGRRQAPFVITEVTNARGDLIWRRRDPPAETVLDPAKARQMVSMLTEVIRSGTGRLADIGRPAAGKTGTSQDYRDAWFIGFTPDLLAGVWLGDDRARPMDRVAGGSLPAAAWARFMSAAEAAAPVRDFPPAGAPPETGSRETGPDPTGFYAALARRLRAAAAAEEPAGDPAAPDPPP